MQLASPATTVKMLQSGGPPPFNTNTSLLTGLVAWWDVDEPNGIRYDSSTSGYHLTDQNNNVTATARTGAPTGLPTQVGRFISGGSPYLTHASQPVLAGSFTISTWVNSDATNRGVYWRGADVNNSNYAIWLTGGNTANTLVGNGTTFATTSRSYSANTWAHLVQTWDGATVSLYLNNGTPGTASLIGPCYSGAGAFLLGRYLPTSFNMDGLLAATGMWSRVLTAGEISTLYNSGNGLIY